MFNLKNIIKKSESAIKYAFLMGMMILIFSACTENYEKYDKFTNTYYKVLIAREVFEDSLVQANEVKKILKENGYTEQSFAEETMKIFSEDQKVLTMIVDSLRKKVIRDTDSLQKEKMKELFKRSADSAANAANERK